MLLDSWRAAVAGHKDEHVGPTQPAQGDVHGSWIPGVDLVVRIVTTYLQTWKVAVCHLSGYWGEHAAATKRIQENFRPIPIGPNLILNAAGLVPFILFLNWLVGFSDGYQRFIALYSLMPTMIMAVCYYSFLYGNKIWELTPTIIGRWVNNWLMATCVAMVSFTQMALHYFILLWLERFLPQEWHFCMSFPMGTIEDSAQTVIMLLYGLGFVLLATTPLWTRGYEICMQTVGRSERLDGWEACIEIVYTTSQAAVVLQLQTGLALLQEGWGFKFHFIHFAVALVEAMFLHQTARLKGAWIHQLNHEVRALYNMTHIEHHICKGIYPTTPATGIWEPWVEGGTLFFCNTLACVPFLFFHANLSGPNVAVHTMWPHKSLIQWHTLHHTVHADIYAINVPSAYDEKFSRDVQKYKEPLTKSSFFIRNPAMSDIVGFALTLLVGAVMHFGFGVGVFQVWHERVLHFVQP